jgi:hypothetical protein
MVRKGNEWTTTMRRSALREKAVARTREAGRF